MTSPVRELPVLTDVLIPGAVPAAGVPGNPGLDRLALDMPTLDVQALEARLLDQLTQRLQATLEQRVHASVVPAVSLLADRIAFKAAQEVAADLTERMRDDLKAAVQEALESALKGR
jgi:hypothetical protein